MITIEPAGEGDHGHCADCGQPIRRVWGYVSNQDGARAVYFIRWTEGHRDRGAHVLVSIGVWGAESTANRVAFGLECRIDDNGPGFMVIDARELPWAHEKFLGRKLTQAEALASSLKPEVFQILDVLIDQDPRFQAFLGRAQ